MINISFVVELNCIANKVTFNLQRISDYLLIKYQSYPKSSKPE